MGEALGADDSMVTTGALITNDEYALRRVEFVVEFMRAFFSVSANDALGAFSVVMIVVMVGGGLLVIWYETVESTSVLLPVL